ncbi:hypothetical protein GI364_23145 [Alicyclobacillus sp. SO9]|nr:hypothetical protein GI364_23145 [Alicyclobacillus sp. SO9]
MGTFPLISIADPAAGWDFAGTNKSLLEGLFSGVAVIGRSWITTRSDKGDKFNG